MRRPLPVTPVLSVMLIVQACSAPAVQERRLETVQAEVIALERAALDRWIKADPDGYLSLYASEVTYFDPFREKRVDGLEAMRAALAPIRGATRPFTEVRYEMIDPRVQLHGDVALLTFNVVNYGKLPDRPENVLARWNSTEVYARIDDAWKIIHSHWSSVKPDVKPPAM